MCYKNIQCQLKKSREGLWATKSVSAPERRTINILFIFHKTLFRSPQLFSHGWAWYYCQAMCDKNINFNFMGPAETISYMMEAQLSEFNSYQPADRNAASLCLKLIFCMKLIFFFFFFKLKNFTVWSSLILEYTWLNWRGLLGLGWGMRSTFF